MGRRQQAGQGRQAGMALMLTLAALLILTLLGLSGTQTAILQARMAQSHRDMGLAFQAAEAALQAGEAWVEAMADLSAFPAAGACDGGLCNATDGVQRWQGLDWQDADASRQAPGLPGLAAAPRCLIELVASLPQPDPSGSGAVLRTHWFRITARGTGARPGTAALLQTAYAIRRASQPGLSLADAPRVGRLSWRRL